MQGSVSIFIPGRRLKREFTEKCIRKSVATDLDRKEFIEEFESRLKVPQNIVSSMASQSNRLWAVAKNHLPPHLQLTGRLWYLCTPTQDRTLKISQSPSSSHLWIGRRLNCSLSIPGLVHSRLVSQKLWPIAMSTSFLLGDFQFAKILF